MNQPMPIGAYTLFKTSLDSEILHLLTFDFSTEHRIIAGLTVASATTRILKSNAASADLTLSAQAIDGTSKMVQVRVTDVSSKVGSQYHLECTAVLSDATALVASIAINIEAA